MNLTVSELKKILTNLEKDGYGNHIVWIGYDDDFAYTTVKDGTFKIQKDYCRGEDGVWFDGW